MIASRAIALAVAAACVGPLRAEVSELGNGSFQTANSVAPEQGGMIAAIQRSIAEEEMMCRLRGGKAEDVEFRAEDLTPQASVATIVFRCVDPADLAGLARANEGARKLADAMQRFDAAAVVESMYPKVFSAAVAKEAVMGKVAEQYEGLRQRKLRIAVKLAEGKELGHAGSQVFVFIPYRMEMSREASEKRVLTPGMFVALSDDRGLSWKYVEYQESELRRYLPDYRGTPAIPTGLPAERFR